MTKNVHSFYAQNWITLNIADTVKHSNQQVVVLYFMTVIHKKSAVTRVTVSTIVQSLSDIM